VFFHRLNLYGLKSVFKVTDHSYLLLKKSDKIQTIWLNSLTSFRFINVKIMIMLYNSIDDDLIFCKLYLHSSDPAIPSWISNQFSFPHEVWHNSVVAIEAPLVFITCWFCWYVSSHTLWETLLAYWTSLADKRMVHDVDNWEAWLPFSVYRQLPYILHLCLPISKNDEWSKGHTNDFRNLIYAMKPINL